jgi:hypothetical protein
LAVPVPPFIRTRRNDDSEELFSISACHEPPAVHSSQANIGTLLCQNLNRFAHARSVSVRRWRLLEASTEGKFQPIAGFSDGGQKGFFLASGLATSGPHPGVGPPREGIVAELEGVASSITSIRLWVGLSWGPGVDHGGAGPLASRVQAPAQFHGTRRK